MPTAEADDAENGLPPPGTRWGTGVQSVLPYLTKSLQQRPAATQDRDPPSRDSPYREPPPSAA